jgi:hypothetical protein
MKSLTAANQFNSCNAVMVIMVLSFLPLARALQVRTVDSLVPFLTALTSKLPVP